MSIKNAEILWLESKQPYSSQFDDIYYSSEGGLEESQHNFIAANNLNQRRLSSHPLHSKRFTIGELGFGTGLNFLLCMQLWLECSEPTHPLHYIAFEKHPLKPAALAKALQCWPQLQKFSEKLTSQYSDLGNGIQRLLFGEHIILDLHFGDATASLSDMESSQGLVVDAWFLDGFSPKQNPDMWSISLFEQLAKHSDTRTTLSSYSVAGDVRRGLSGVGFKVSRPTGFGKKRQMLLASFEGNQSNDISKQRITSPWFHLPKPSSHRGEVIIIGAGLAGCSSAYSLASRGWKVTVIEAAKSIASAASGNRQTVLKCKLFKQQSHAAEFYLQAYLFASRQFQDLSQQFAFHWQQCGVLQLDSAINNTAANHTSATSSNDKDLAIKQKQLAEFIADFYRSDLATVVKTESASSIAGIELTEGGYHLPHGGWLDSVKLCQAYLTHSNITLVLDTTVTAFSQAQDQQGRWSVSSTTQNWQADSLVIANSTSCDSFEQTHKLPIVPVKGQTSNYTGNKLSAAIQAVICGQRTICPSHGGMHTLGASYERLPMDENTATNNASASFDAINDQANLENLQGVLASLKEPQRLELKLQDARAAVRCSSKDHLPIVGLVADHEAMQDSYALLRRNAKQQFDHGGDYFNNLYINVAHGSHGLTSTPLAAEYLASLINNEIAIYRTITRVEITAVANKYLKPSQRVELEYLPQEATEN